MGGNIAGIVTGLLSKGGPSLDLKALYQTIQGAGQYQRGIINALPEGIKKNLAEYEQSLNTAGADYKSNTQGQLQDYLQKISGIYGPNSEAANAQKTAVRGDIYSTVPGTQNAIRNVMAAQGGLGRGQASAALAAPYTQAAQQYGSAAAGIDATQSQAGQQAMQQALNTVNTMEANMFQQLFGMSKEQATQILSSGNAALSDQLSQLINQSNNETNQVLGVQGLEANNKYQNDVAATALHNGIIGNAVNLGVNGAQAAFTGGMGGSSAGLFSGLMGGGGSGLPMGADVASNSYYSNAMNNKPMAIR
jgi:hypothetical protein